MNLTEERALRDYCSEYYQHLNPLLRAGKHDLLLGRNRAIVEVLDSLISASKAPDDIVAWRAVTADMAAMLDAQQPGATVQDPAFMSLANDRAIIALSESSAGAMKILIPKGTAIYSHPDEGELILHRDSTLEYLGKREAMEAPDTQPEDASAYVFRVRSQDRSGGKKNGSP